MSASQIRKKQEERSLQTLREIASQPHNKRCVECQQRGPTYADMTTLSFVCTSCSGHLRGLNPPHRLKSISMTTFTDAEIESLRAGGNEVSKAKWLAKWDSKKDKEPDNKDDSQLVHFLREKYERRKWYSDTPVKPQTDTPVQKEPSQISISKPPEVAKSPQRHPSLEARPRPTQSNSQSSLSASTSSTKEVTPPTKPKPDLFGGQNDPFGPSPNISESPSMHKKPPPGSVAVLPPGGAPLLPGQQQSDEFGAFTSSQSSKKNDLAGVSLQGVGATSVTGSSSFPGRSGSDKYSALAQLDVAVKEITLKDNPPSNEGSTEGWSSGSSHNVNPFGGAAGSIAQPNMQPQPNPFMAAGAGMQQGFGQFVSAQPQPMPQQSGWGQPQGGPMYNNPQQGGFGNTQFQGQAGFPAVGGGFAQQPQGIFGAGGPTQFPGGFPQQQQQQPQQGQWQSQPTQQRAQQQWQQQQQPVFGGASQSFGVSKSASATTPPSTTSTSLQLGWSSGLSKPLATTSNVETVPASTGGTGWSMGLTAPTPQPSAQLNWNTPAATGNMRQQNWGGSGSAMQQQPGVGWGSGGQQPMFGVVPQQQNQMFGGGGAPAFAQPNQMYMSQQPQMFGAGAPQQQQTFGMPSQQPQQQSFGNWSQNSTPQQQGGFNWGNQPMPSGGLQRKDSKNIIVGNWGTQPSNLQQGDMTSYIPNNMNTSNPFTASSNKGTSNNPFL